MGRSNKTFIEIFLYELTNCFILLLIQAKWLLNDWLEVWFEINGMIIGFSCREGSDRAFRKDCRKEIMKFLRNKVFRFLSSFLFAFDILQILRFRHFVLYPLFSNIRRLFFKCNGLDNKRIELSFNPVVGKFMFVSWFSLCKGDNEFFVKIVEIFFDLTLNVKHYFINVDLGGFFPPRELLFSPINFWIGFDEPRVSQNNLLRSQRSHQKLCILLPSFHLKVGGHVFPNRTVLVLSSIHVHYGNFFP